MALADVVEVAARTGDPPRLAPLRPLHAQARRALVPLARYGHQGAAPGAAHMNVDAAYAECRAIAHKHGANFSVGFRFLPRRKRRAVYAAYAYCRVADDIADEGAGSEQVYAELGEWQAE